MSEDIAVFVYNDSLFMLSEFRGDYEWYYAWKCVFSNYEDMLGEKFDTCEEAIDYAEEEYTDDIQYFSEVFNLTQWINTVNIYG